MLKRTQVYLEDDVLELFHARAKTEGISVAELLRNLMRKEIKAKRKKYADLGRRYFEHPLDDIIGIGNSGDPNNSVHHDEIYLKN